MGENDKDIKLVHCVLITQVVTFSTSVISQQVLRIQLREHALVHFAQDEGFKIKSYYSDNGIFSSFEFNSDCEKLEQKINYSGVDARHQDGVAERNIKTIASSAQANLLHAA